METIKEFIDFYYNNGFDLHPLLPNSKVPSRKDWNNLKKLSKEQILSLYKDNITSEHSYNLGFRPGKRSLAVSDGVEYCVIVVDVDIKGNDKHIEGIDRSKLFKKEPSEYNKYKERVAFVSDWLEKLNLNINVITGSGGFHSYLLIRTDIYETLTLKANQTIYKNDELGIEIELLADGKNCVLPPSKIPLNNRDREYKLINDSFNFIDDRGHEVINLIKSSQEQEPVIYQEPAQEPIHEIDENNDNITALITELAKNKTKLNGYEFELNLIGYCIDKGLTTLIPELFKVFYGKGYDAKRTNTLLKQAQNKQNIRHAGSFIKMLTDAGLDGLVLKYLKTNTPVKREFKTMGVALKNIHNILRTKFNLMFPAGKLSLVVGNGSVGKTYIALYIALLFVKTNPGRTVFLLLCEDDEYTVLMRMQRLIEDYPFLDSEYKDNIHYICDSDEEIIKINRFTKELYYNPQSGIRELIHDHDVNIFDPLANLLPGDENDNNVAADFCKIMRSFIVNSGRSIIFLHHVNKVRVEQINQDSILAKKLNYGEVADRIDKVRGASAFYNAVRYCLYVEKSGDKDSNTAVCACIKNNYGRVGYIPLILDLPEFKTDQVENINPYFYKNSV